MNRRATGNGSNHTRRITLLHGAGHYLLDPGEHVIIEALGAAHTVRV